MITLRSMTSADADLLQDLPYAAMPPEAMRQMFLESAAKTHDGKYFELLAVMDGNVCVGVINFCGSGQTASCAPDIKPQFRRQGFGEAAMLQALEYAKTLDYEKAVAQVRQDNAASIALHRKLGFSQCAAYINGKGNPVVAFEKDLLENR